MSKRANRPIKPTATADDSASSVDEAQHDLGLAAAESPPALAKVGRPSAYNEAVAAEICRRLASGEALYRICEEKEMPDDMTVMRWVDNHAEFRGKFAHARRTQGNRLGDKVMELAGAAADGSVDYNAARVAMDGFKWVAGRLAPLEYGDRIDIQVEQNTRVSVTVDAQLQSMMGSIANEPEIVAEQEAEMRLIEEQRQEDEQARG